MERADQSSHPGLLTDLYHPDAAYVAWRTGHTGLTTFDLYTRRVPFGGAYLLVAGLEAALDFVRAFRYAEEDLAYLREVRGYDEGFLDFLGRLRFEGDILAMPEGTVAFPNEPLLRVTAPFPQALLLESGLLQAINVATLIATKASRVVWAAQGRAVAEFGLRRAQAPFVAARSSLIGGAVSTSYLDAARRLGAPPSGTMPHALIQLFDTEREAFQAMAEAYPRYTLLLDTYDPRAAIHTAAEVARDAEVRTGHQLAAVRLDSGDLAGDARYVRRVLDEAGLKGVRILASGDLDEYKIAELLAQGAPFDAFGVGTSLAVGAGSVEHGVEGAALGGVYKEVMYQDQRGEHARIKLAGDKSTWPGVKQVYRKGTFEEDVVQLASEPPPERAEPLLRAVVMDGQVLDGVLPPLSEIVARARRSLEELPGPYQRLLGPPTYPVRMSERLQALRETARRQYGQGMDAAESMEGLQTGGGWR